MIVHLNKEAYDFIKEEITRELQTCECQLKLPHDDRVKNYLLDRKQKLYITLLELNHKPEKA
jgi:hypothetical protein